MQSQMFFKKKSNILGLDFIRACELTVSNPSSLLWAPPNTDRTEPHTHARAGSPLFSRVVLWVWALMKLVSSEVKMFPPSLSLPFSW